MCGSHYDKALASAAEAIQTAEALLITAGAGMGVDSGLPDFRGKQGFWNAYPAVAKLGLSFEEMANPAWFERSPHLAWAFYGHRLNLYRRATPHPGFARLLEIASRKLMGAFVFTSNVDGHFQKAGFSAESIVECHGSIQHFQCVSPCSDTVWDASNKAVTVDEQEFRALEPLPRCPECGSLARPNILMFGDWSWIRNRTYRQHRAFDEWLARIMARRAKLAVVELGAGTAIPTVRATSENAVAQTEGTLIRVNPREFGVPSGQIGLPFGAAEAMERICIRLRTG